ncbi:MAG TPA: exopolysaccharide biosynthesis protein [Caulobacteraceae bacterium]|jgi:hypothetical protein
MHATVRRIDLHDEPISAVLRRLMASGGERVSVDEISDAFGSRAFGAVLFAFSVPNLLPLPPGSSTVLSVPLIILTPQVALGMKHPWIPRWLGHRNLEREKLRHLFDRLLPKLERLEKVMRPRLGALFSPWGDRLIGLVCFLLTLVLILPIPFGNLLPAMSIAALSLGLATRDGVVALIGYALAAISVTVLVLTANVAIAAAQQLVHIFGI